MADKQDEQARLAGPFHSFRVVHVTRAGGHNAGSAEVSTGHLSPAAARDWISQVAKDHRISQREPIHPAYGVPVDVARQLGLDVPRTAGGEAAEWAQDQLAQAASGPESGGEGAAGSDA